MQAQKAVKRLEGFELEQAVLAMVSRFKDAAEGVPGEDALAALDAETRGNTELRDAILSRTVRQAV